MNSSAENRRLALGIFGCPPDTGNLGVSALALGSIRGLASVGVPIDFTLGLFKKTQRTQDLVDGYADTPIRLLPCEHSRRFYRPGNMDSARFFARLGLTNSHPFLRAIEGLDAVLDISGGDSFSDIYGDWRFKAVTLSKRIALDMRKPLILLPQTYGPFRGERTRIEARELIASATQAWARDAESLEIVRDLLGSDFDSKRCRLGVDVAFGLPSTPPPAEVAEPIEAFASRGICLGLNVSGLLFQLAGREREQFGFQSEYRALMRSLLDALLRDESHRVLLLPHVVPDDRPAEDDALACRALFDALSPMQRSRVLIAPFTGRPDHAKWMVSRCSWFCGTRMHSCIAGLSSAVPTLGLAYSDKTRGVFATAGVGASVVDPRTETAQGIVERVRSSLAERDEVAAKLAIALPRMRSTLEAQFAEICSGARAR